MTAILLPLPALEFAWRFEPFAGALESLSVFVALRIAEDLALERLPHGPGMVVARRQCHERRAIADGSRKLFCR